MEIGKYASEIGVVAAARHFSREVSKPRVVLMTHTCRKYSAIFITRVKYKGCTFRRGPLP